MSLKSDYYEILQVSPNASQEVISAAYRRLAQIYHPDHGGSEEKMKLLNKVYEVLGNPEKRRMYDSWREQAAYADIPLKDSSKSTIVPEVSQVRPWVRFWARLIDYYLYAILVGFISGLTGILLDSSGTVFYFVTMGTWPFIEALFISQYGATPGKALLKTKVIKENGEMLSYIDAFIRSLWVFVQGLGLGIPLVTIITMCISINRLSSTGSTAWDGYYSSIVTHEKIGILRSLISFSIIFALFSLSIAVSSIE